MKIAITNYTGTVGKTTVAAHLLAPRMEDAPIFAIETINETAEGLGIDVEKIKGDKFRDLFKSLITLDDAIIDVGASNVEDFLNGMARFEDSHLEIDKFVIPVTSGTKEQKETMTMIQTLAEFGIEPSKILILFNRVNSDVREEFPLIINYAKKEKNCTVNTDAAIFENEVFDMLAVRQLTISAALSDETDYKAKLRELGKDGDAKLKSKYADLHAIKALAKSVNRNLDTVFAIISKL
jgi:MinD-like ATPase involved in chromosome partitioning or flagellar assembly